MGLNITEAVPVRLYRPASLLDPICVTAEQFLRLPFDGNCLIDFPFAAYCCRVLFSHRFTTTKNEFNMKTRIRYRLRLWTFSKFVKMTEIRAFDLGFLWRCEPSRAGVKFGGSKAGITLWLLILRIQSANHVFCISWYNSSTENCSTVNTRPAVGNSSKDGGHELVDS